MRREIERIVSLATFASLAQLFAAVILVDRTSWWLDVTAPGVVLAPLGVLALATGIVALGMRSRPRARALAAVAAGCCAVVAACPLSWIVGDMIVPRSRFVITPISLADASASTVLPEIAAGPRICGYTVGGGSGTRRERVTLGPLLVETECEPGGCEARAFLDPNQSGALEGGPASAETRCDGKPARDAPCGPLPEELSAVRRALEPARSSLALHVDHARERLVLVRYRAASFSDALSLPRAVSVIEGVSIRPAPSPIALLRTLFTRASVSFIAAFGGTVLAALLLVASVLRRAPSRPAHWTVGTLDEHGTVHLPDSVTLHAPPGLPPGPVLVRTRALTAPAYRASAVLASVDVRSGSMATLLDAHHARSASLALLSVGVAALAGTPLAVLWCAMRSLPQ